MTWTSYNMVATVARGTETLAFTYDSEHQRIKQGVSSTGQRTLYINAQVRSERLEVASNGSLIRWNNYIYAPGSGSGAGSGEMVAVFYDHASTTDQTRFFHKDHLGSISAITDESGAVVQRLAYDAWGRRRHGTSWADDPNEAIAPTVLTDRGYTGHEHLDEVALVHMNGRIYDPQLGRFMSADPFVQDPLNTQSLNRYSYVINNPLAYTDPNGFFFKSIFKAVTSIFRSPFVQQVVQAAAAMSGNVWVVAAVAAATTAANGGNVSDMFKSAAIAAAAYSTHSGNGADGGFDIPIPVMSTSGTRRDGGNEAPSVGAGPQLAAQLQVQAFAQRLFSWATIGGTASPSADGKFANGAATASYAYTVGLGDGEMPFPQDVTSNERPPAVVDFILGFVPGYDLLANAIGNPEATRLDYAVGILGIAPVVGKGAGWALKTGRAADVGANRIRGLAAEERVLRELGLGRNTSAVATAEGRSIPDALTNALSIEIKDAANVSLTRQLRIQTEAARHAGRESVLITGERTCVSGPCSRAFDLIVRRPDLGPQ